MHISYRLGEWIVLKDWQVSELIHYGNGSRDELERTGMCVTELGTIYHVQSTSEIERILTELTLELQHIVA